MLHLITCHRHIMPRLVELLLPCTLSIWIDTNSVDPDQIPQIAALFRNSNRSNGLVEILGQNSICCPTTLIPALFARKKVGLLRCPAFSSCICVFLIDTLFLSNKLETSRYQLGILFRCMIFSVLQISRVFTLFIQLKYTIKLICMHTKM